jgi:hypothetical protein
MIRDEIIASIVGVSGALLGVVIGWLLNRSTVNHTIKQQEFYKAASAFRAAFTDEYRALKAVVRTEDIEDAFIQTTLANAAAKHEKACVLFRPYLTEKKKQQFDQAWQDYVCPEGGDVADLPSPFIDYYNETRPDVSIKLALEKLDRLMEFAKPI